VLFHNSNRLSARKRVFAYRSANLVLLVNPNSAHQPMPEFRLTKLLYLFRGQIHSDITKYIRVKTGIDITRLESIEPRVR